MNLKEFKSLYSYYSELNIYYKVRLFFLFYVAVGMHITNTHTQSTFLDLIGGYSEVTESEGNRKQY